ncbi:recombinase family protein [Fictibacillus enclensis]|uniref:recombinase family protein n=1 Tax=Fictibacillus enclensis TaxID=1017270 RepID=UPI0025A2C8D2|nr:recombinase family protein [Fictibacillus enclensis]MDM5336364.1 recombinase family protein [Fictibacillus enclensis]
MNLAFGYVRRSSYKQQENNSVEIQKAYIQELAKRKNVSVPEEFIYVEDVTSAYAKRAKQRKELMRLKNMMIERGIDKVIFYEESRMDRTGYSFVLDFYRPLQDHFPNLEVYSTTSDTPFDPSDFRTKITLLLYRQESEIKSERAIASLTSFLNNEEKLRPGSKCPYGYELVNKKLLPNEDADIVTFIYYLQSWGLSMQKIAAVLNDASIPSPSGKVWRSSSIEAILKNKVYTGTLTWNVHKGKEPKLYEFNDFSEPLIDDFLIKLITANTKLQKKYGRLDTPFIFLNKLFCRQCNEKLLTQNGSTTGEGKKYYYQYFVSANHVTIN